MPSPNNTAKQKILTKPDGIIGTRRLPISKNISRIPAEIRSMTAMEDIGIFTRLVPYAKLATKASTESAVTRTSASKKARKKKVHITHPKYYS